MILDFDGALKRNPWVERGREALYGLEEVKVTEYSWGLGCVINNQTKAYALYKGIQLAKENQVAPLIVLGDSLLLIKYLLKGSSMRQKTLESPMKRIRKAT